MLTEDQPTYLLVRLRQTRHILPREKDYFHLEEVTQSLMRDWWIDQQSIRGIKYCDEYIGIWVLSMLCSKEIPRSNLFFKSKIFFIQLLRGNK